jgi:RNA polymerase sigma-70 factor (ECF subfamily)
MYLAVRPEGAIVGRTVEPGDGIDAPSDRARFEQMLARHHRKLRRFVAGIVADRDRVDDVLQESYYRAYRKLPRRFENDAHEATWLFRVTYRCCLDELRSRRRRPEAPTAELQLAVVGSEPHRLVVVEEAFRSLDPADRAVLLLVGVIGLDQATAAQVLGLARGTVAWRLSGARARLRDALGGEE